MSSAAEPPAAAGAGGRTPGPLAGIRVLELAGYRTEYCGKLLADMGADVITAEPPEGSASRRIGPFAGDRPDLNRSLHYWYYNTSKRGVTLNPEHPDAAPLLARLVARADVVIEAAAPGTLEAAGRGFETFAPVRPELVWIAITSFGQQGPYSSFTMTDLTSMAMGGPMASCGYDDLPGSPPIRPEAGHSVLMAGVYAANAALIALLERQASGRGQYVDLSIHEACSATTEGSFPNWEYFRRIVRRQTGRHAAALPTPRWQFHCTDGRDINVIGGGIPRSPRSWKPLVAWMEREGKLEDLDSPEYEGALHDNPYQRREQAGHINEVIGRFIESMPAEAAYRGGQALHMPWGPVRAPDENLDDPHWRDRGFFVEVEHPELGRSFTYPGLPYLFNGTPGGVRRRAPLLGEHTWEVYAGELGNTSEQLRLLFEQGAI